MRPRFTQVRIVIAASVLAWLPLAAIAAGESVGPRGELGPARMFSVESVMGAASVMRRGSPVLLQRGYLVFNGETAEVREDSRLTLFLGPFGTLEMGPGRLTASKLPAAPWASDLDTRLQLERGHLRLQWKPAAGKNWPLAIRLGGWMARVGNGEHFFHVTDDGVAVCNLQGAIKMTSVGTAAATHAVAENSCLQVQPGEPRLLAMPADQWSLVFDEDLDAVIAAAAPAAGTTEVVTPDVPQSPPLAEAPAEPSDARSPVIVGQGNVATIYTQPDAPLVPRDEWLVNVISVRDAALADRHAKTLVTAGFAARVRTETVHGQPSYRVIVPGIQDGAAASGIAQQLAGRFGFSDAWAMQRN